MDSSYIFKGPIDNLKLKGVSFAELLYDSLRKKEQSNILLVDENTDEGICRGDLLQNSIKLAVILQQMGICENDRVGIISANTWKFVVPTLSAIFIGATVTPINPAATKDDLRHYLTLSKPKILFVSSDVLEKVRELKNDLSFLKHIIVLDAEDVENDELVFNELFNRDVNYKTFQIHKDNSAEALILYSSGTTGFPKGVVLSQENVLNAMEYCSDPDYLNINEDSIILGILPLFHVFGLLLMYAYLWLGKRIIFSRKFKPDTFLKSIEKYEISYLVTVPPLLLFLAKSPLVDNYDIRSIKHIFCGAAPLGKEVENIASQRFKIPICQLYGMSECAAITITSPKYYKSGSVGKVVPGHEAKIIDPESGNILPPTVSGEICFKGPTVMKGYIDNEKATKETIDKDGYLHTGDIGYFDEEGYLFILDRIKDLIKYKGFQVPPALLEDILQKHPDVKDAAVVGKPDERSGELPTAFIVRHPNAEINEQEIINYIAERVSTEKQLHGGVLFTNEIPRTNSGKILKKELKKALL
ncbi:4-coumarate--CoA ligase 1-like [Anoplophora glabripennis]|uniref:4-coumarate--CoA ligase 1-like n=1 Tax=Anoplophora glabripennis TaxID=217634 RepID=UPI000874FE8C|nr:4-coumarate--CoA ligase 1-like [Anoplophora glabripennis]